MSGPISTRQPEVSVVYTSKRGTRKVRHFKDAFKARRFFTQQDKLGNNPTVKKGGSAHENGVIKQHDSGLQIEYGPKNKRQYKYFLENTVECRAFYTEQFELGNEPTILRSEDMVTTTKKSATKKSTAKKSSTKRATKSAKSPAKKKTSKTTKKREPKSKDGVRTSVIEKVKPTLEFLLKNPDSTKKEIREATNNKALGIPWLEKNSYILKEDLEEKRGMSYKITPEGKKFLGTL